MCMGCVVLYLYKGRVGWVLKVSCGILWRPWVVVGRRVVGGRLAKLAGDPGVGGGDPRDVSQHTGLETTVCYTADPVSVSR